MADRQFLQQLTRKLADEGKLIEAGWVGMRLHVMRPDAPADQLREMRMAFMAGAQYLFSSMMDALDQDHEPTDADMRRMDLINAELQAFTKELELRVAKSAGSA